MKKTIAAISSVLAVLLIGWLIVNLRAKSNYDKMRNEIPSGYAVIPMDQVMKSFMAEVQSNWNCTTNTVGGPDSDVIKLAGMNPSVRNLIHVWNYQMPEYCWWSPSRNRQPILIGLLKAKFFPVSVDRKFHVSENQDLALLWCRTNMVHIYHDEANGMRASLYVKKRKKIEPDGAANGDQSSRSQTNGTSRAAPSAEIK
jgi:hypothetical protein